MVKRTFGLGTIRVRGSDVSFSPVADHALAAKVGDVAAVGFTFRYEEGSVGRNAGRIVFALTVDGVERAASVKLRDVPLVKDDQRGFLEVLVELPEAGEVAGAWTLEVAVEDGPWLLAGDVKKSDFRAEGKILIRVQP